MDFRCEYVCPARRDRWRVWPPVVKPKKLIAKILILSYLTEPGHERSNLQPQLDRLLPAEAPGSARVPSELNPLTQVRRNEKPKQTRGQNVTSRTVWKNLRGGAKNTTVHVHAIHCVSVCATVNKKPRLNAYHAACNRETCKDRRWPELAVRMVRLHRPGNKVPGSPGGPGSPGCLVVPRTSSLAQSHRSCDADCCVGRGHFHGGILQHSHPPFTHP